MYHEGTPDQELDYDVNADLPERATFRAYKMFRTEYNPNDPKTYKYKGLLFPLYINADGGYQIGIFWYDSNKDDLFGVNKIDAEDVPFIHCFDGEIKQYKNLHKDIWMKEFRKGKDDRFVGDYTQIPRGRVCEYKDKGFVVFVGDWIDTYPQVKEEIIYEFELPEYTTFVKDEHWNIGHGWSDELI